MLKITRNTTSTIWATFSEKMQNVENWVLLELTSESNPQQKFVTILNDNISEYFPRIDKYNITETDTIDENTTQQISLPYNGFYEYRAFELEPTQEYVMPGYIAVGYFEQSEPLKLGLIEIGRCKVDGEFSEEVHSVYK